jgi:hypothetical protein
MVPTVPDAFCVKERDPTVFRIYADLFDDKALTSIKDCLAYSNVLCLLRHGLALPRRLKLIGFTSAIGQKELDQGKGRACSAKNRSQNGPPTPAVFGANRTLTSWNRILQPNRIGLMEVVPGLK